MMKDYRYLALGLLLVTGCTGTFLDLVLVPVAIGIKIAESVDEDRRTRLRAALQAAEQSAGPATVCTAYLNKGPHRAAFVDEFGPSGACWENGQVLRKKCLAICLQLGNQGMSDSSRSDLETSLVESVRDAVSTIRQQETAVAALAVARLPMLVKESPDRPKGQPLEQCSWYLSTTPSQAPAFKSAFGAQGQCWTGDVNAGQWCNDLCEKMSLTKREITTQMIAYPGWD